MTFFTIYPRKTIGLTFIGFLLLAPIKAWPLEIQDNFDLSLKSEFEYLGSPFSGSGRGSFPASSFQLGKLSLIPQFWLSENKKGANLFSELRFKTNSSKVRRVFVKIPVSNSFSIVAGKDKPFYSMSRDTNIYPLPGAVFWDQRPVGVSLNAKLGPAFAHLSVSNGVRLVSNTTNDHELFASIVDEELNFDSNENKDLGLGAGIKYRGYRILGFFLFQKLSDADANFLESLSTSIAGDRRYVRGGANFEGKLVKLGEKSLSLQGQYIQSRAGNLKRSGFSVTPKVKLPTHKSYLDELSFLASYSTSHVSLNESLGFPESWNRRNLTLASILGMTKNLNLLFEYNFIFESTGAEKIDNDGFVIQLGLELL